VSLYSEDIEIDDNDYSDDDDYCEECGDRLNEVGLCDSCDAEINDGR
jgi:hypothetical protein